MIEIVEVSARDGLQNEAALFSTAQKIALIERMVAAGARRLEVASFVRADRVPQMADAEAVIAGLDLPDDVVTIGLVMNLRGLERALRTPVAEIGAVCVASDGFARDNQGQTAREAVEVAAPIVREARAAGRRAQATIAAAFGCPFEGEVDPDHVVALARALAEAGPVEIAVADTIGVAVPRDVAVLVTRLRAATGLPVRVHLHDTRGTGIANAWAAIGAGAATLDGSVGGIGGCPFAPAATGNVATEDLLYLCDRSDVATELDLVRTIDAARWLGGEMGWSLPGSVGRAGGFFGTGTSMTDNRGALSDIRVIELGQLIAGPFCGQLLGDTGAQVIKVEPPGKGDPMRDWGHGEDKLWWEVVARNKLSVSANLRVAEGQAIVRRLVEQADILIENFKPGTIEKWGLGPDALHAINPRLLIVRVSGYGQTGPYVSSAGFGGIDEAMGWRRAIVGDAERPPSRMGVSIGDSLVATYGCLGALAALHARTRTGKGQVVESAPYEALLQVMESLVPEYVVSGHVRRRSGSVLEGIAPSNVYPCSDGEYLIGANQDAVFARLCAAMGQPALSSDPRYATHVARGRHQAELDARIADWTRTLTIAEVEAATIAHSVPAGRIYGAAEMLADPHFAAREALVEVDSPRRGTFAMQNSVPRLSGTPAGIRSLAPATVGADNNRVYRDMLGMDAAELERLRAGGAI